MASIIGRQLIQPCLLAAALLGGSTPSLAYNDDTHYGATFAIAFALGLGWERALLIASANQAVDTNVFTKPTMHVGLGAGATSKEVRQFDALGASIGLSLQDYYFHCFSPTADKRGERSPIVDDHLKQLETHANALIEKGNAPDSEGNTRSLVAIGVYLHCQQDSWSHSSYGDHAFGHVLDDALGKSPDELARYPSISRRALLETTEKLESFRARYGIKADLLTRNEIVQLVNALTDEPSGHDKTIPVPDRKQCNKVITEYWLAKLVATYPMLHDQKLPADTYTHTIGPVVYETRFELQKGPPQKRLVSASYLINWECQELFAKAFPEIKAKRRFKSETFHNIQIETDWAEPVRLSFMKLPAQQLPILRVQLNVDPVFDGKSDYERWQIERK